MAPAGALAEVLNQHEDPEGWKAECDLVAAAERRRDFAREELRHEARGPLRRLRTLISEMGPTAPHRCRVSKANRAWLTSRARGAAVKALLTQPRGVAADSKRNPYIADTSNNRVRRGDLFGIIAMVAGTGESDGPGWRTGYRRRPLVPERSGCRVGRQPVHCGHRERQNPVRQHHPRADVWALGVTVWSVVVWTYSCATSGCQRAQKRSNTGAGQDWERSGAVRLADWRMGCPY